MGSWRRRRKERQKKRETIQSRFCYPSCCSIPLSRAHHDATPCLQPRPPFHRSSRIPECRGWIGVCTPIWASCALFPLLASHRLGGLHSSGPRPASAWDDDGVRLQRISFLSSERDPHSRTPFALFLPNTSQHFRLSRVAVRRPPTQPLEPRDRDTPAFPCHTQPRTSPTTIARHALSVHRS